MNELSNITEQPRPHECPPLRRTLADIALVIAVSAAVIGITADAPPNTYLHAQLQQIGSAMGTVGSGEWLLPRDHMGGLARKAPLQTWMCAAAIKLTGLHTDFVFRLPTILASLVTGVLVYALGRRWFGRKVGLLAGCLWAAPHHMGKLMYIAVTDMMFTMWITLAVFCADRLLFHRAPRRRRVWWAAGLWAAVIGGTLTKGPANLVLLGGILALATAVGTGFAALRGVGWLVKPVLLVRLIARRWWRAIRATHMGWGMLAYAWVIVPLTWAMLAIGGQEYRGILEFEYLARVTGELEYSPSPSSTPAAANLFYYLLPVSVFVAGAMFTTTPRRWFVTRRPMGVAMCWIVGVVAPFSLTHGFRPDYLAPCYPAGALLAAWAIAHLLARRTEPAITVRTWRHIVAAVPICLGVILIATSLVYLFHESMPAVVRKILPMPAVFGRDNMVVLWGLVALGAAGVLLAVRMSLQWRMMGIAWGTVLLSLGVIYLDTHMIGREARTGDGQRMLDFAQNMKPIVGDDDYAIYRGDKLSVQFYMGRFGRRIPPAYEAPQQENPVLDRLNARDARWLVTNDCGLVDMGAAAPDTGGEYEFKVTGPDGKSRQLGFHTLPKELGDVHLRTEPIISQRWGRLYLIDVRRPAAVSGQPTIRPYQSGRQE